jgi:hypothetical protein
LRDPARHLFWMRDDRLIHASIVGIDRGSVNRM